MWYLEKKKKGEMKCCIDTGLGIMLRTKELAGSVARVDDGFGMDKVWILSTDN